MDNKSRIQANNAELRECIEIAESLPDAEGGFPAYNGSYVIIPDAEDNQVLPTLNKLLTDNITVMKIPYQEVTNTKGGLTATIG